MTTLHGDAKTGPTPTLLLGWCIDWEGYHGGGCECANGGLPWGVSGSSRHPGTDGVGGAAIFLVSLWWRLFAG